MKRLYPTTFDDDITARSFEDDRSSSRILNFSLVLFLMLAVLFPIFFLPPSRHEERGNINEDET